MVSTNNGRKTDRPAPYALARPEAEDNPYLTVVPPRPRLSPLTLETPPGVSPRLTRSEQQVFYKGREQLLKMYLTGMQGRYAERQIAHLEIEVSDLFQYLGDRVWERTLAGRGQRDEWLQTQFELFSQAQVIRSGKAMAQIADTTERGLHEIVDEPIEAVVQPTFFNALLDIGRRR
jgi:hypothetical protein